MSRRKQSNPKPLKSDIHEKLPLDFCVDSEKQKGDEEDWTNNSVDNSLADRPPSKSPPAKRKTPDEANNLVKNVKKEHTEEPSHTPKIRLKTNLATDPAKSETSLITIPNLKSEIENSQSPTEYLSKLPPAIQNALSRGYFLPTPIAPLEQPTRPDSADVARPPLYVCPPCGIRFSSLSTLEAHQTYYCSHRGNKSIDDDSKSVTGAEPSGSQSDQDPSEPNSKNLRTGKQYTCTHCSYSADKKVSLNRHMRMHTVSPSPVNVTVSNQDVDNQDRYCAECDIRFSSQKTYKAHKLHYCNSRHMIKQQINSKSSCTSGSSPTSPVDPVTCRTPPSPTGQAPPQQPFLALPTNPIIIVPYSLFRSASVLSGLLPSTAGLPNPDTPCFLLPNGTLQPMTQALSASPTEVLKSANKPREHPPIRESSLTPLDLSIRKSPDRKEQLIDLGSEHEKENVSGSPERIECVPSIHGSPPSTPVSHHGASPPQTVSPRRKPDETSRSSSPKRVRLLSKSSTEMERTYTSPEASQIPFDISIPLLMRAGLFPPEVQMRLTDLPPAIPPVAPQVLVKQGVSKCKECNIVFCKHENYIVHKKHYCSARAQDDDVSKSSSSPPISPRSADTTSPAAQYQQLICMACGIKFTSLDNLNAHQAYYCLKRGELDLRRCGKCKEVLEPGHQCSATSTTAGWKCPCCSVISPTANAAQRHADSHKGVKAYRCTICRYKGNTLRGIRTHVRMHFDKRSPDLQEGKYITCIFDEEGMNAAEVNVVPGAVTPGVIDDRAVSPGSEGRNEPLHHCNLCPYSSIYKANVTRHTKLIHNVPTSEDGVVNGSEKQLKSMPNMDEEEEVIVKKEAIEPEVIIAPIEEGIKDEEVDVQSEGKTGGENDEESILQEAAKPGPKYCKSCDIKFTYYHTFIAHKKFYCSSHAGEITAATPNNNNNNNNTPRAAEASVL